jgi:hypothetical protein
VELPILLLERSGRVSYSSKAKVSSIANDQTDRTI